MSRQVYPMTLKRIFETTVPLRIDIPERNNTFHIQASRCSYFFTIYPQIDDLVSESLDHTQIWISYDQKPIKWYYPIGLLYDLNTINGVWNVTLHLSEYPIEVIPKWTTLNSGYDAYLSMLKEADQIRNGSTKVMMRTSIYDLTRLWESIAKSFQDFDEVRNILLGPDDVYRSLPLRVYLDDGTVVRKLITWAMEDVMKELSISNYELILHGLTIPPETPIVWLQRNACFQDTFIHIIARKIEKA